MTTENLSKARKISSWVVVGLLAALFLMSSGSKLISSQEMVTNFEKWGCRVAHHRRDRGACLRLSCTSSPHLILGVLLLSAHMGGAIVTHLCHGEPFVFQAVILVWCGWATTCQPGNARQFHQMIFTGGARLLKVSQPQ
ncbi:MAG: DoxX family protein [Saprospiraceae bacterium]|nr:DoxX family protein [Saprospiraceae bacterium]